MWGPAEFGSGGGRFGGYDGTESRGEGMSGGAGHGATEGGPGGVRSFCCREMMERLSCRPVQAGGAPVISGRKSPQRVEKIIKASLEGLRRIHVHRFDFTVNINEILSCFRNSGHTRRPLFRGERRERAGRLRSAGHCSSALVMVRTSPFFAPAMGAISEVMRPSGTRPRDREKSR